MYQFLLTGRYLASRLTPLLAVAAVALCVALVIVVVSVMSGFLDMVRASGRTLMGDVIITYPVRGIPWYGQLIKTLEADADVAAATPVVDTWGLLRMPYPDGNAKESERIQIWGIDPDTFSAVTGFADTLTWTTVPDEVKPHLLRDALDRNGDSIVSALDVSARVRLLRHTAPLETAEASDVELESLVRNMEEGDWDVRMRIMALDGIDVLRTALNDEAWRHLIEAEPRLGSNDAVLKDGLRLERNGRPALIAGLHVSQANQRDAEGETEIARNGYWWLPRFDVTLTTLPIDARGGMLDPESVSLPVANEFQSGVYLVDQTRVLVPIDVVQDLTHLDAAERVDPDDPTVVLGVDPARATMVLVRGTDGTTPAALQIKVQALYRQFERAIAQQDVLVQPPSLDLSPGLGVRTWEQQNASFIGPVEKEREVMRTLFSIIYLVCGALIVAIFWAIVYEKTRDIGILRSIGAPRSGIVIIFLLYGLVVGVLGAAAGVGLGWLITTNVNVIHDVLASPPAWPGWASIAVGIALLITGVVLGRGQFLLPVLLGVFAFIACATVGVGLLVLRHYGGLVIWDPSVYYFDEVPSTVDWMSAMVTAIGAVVVSVIAASIPAARAADIDPVKALRYE